MAALTKQQEYLLGRLPKPYDVRKHDEPEPMEVKRARKVINAYVDKESQQKRERERKFKKMLEAAREVIYFGTPEKALAAVRTLEAEFVQEV